MVRWQTGAQGQDGRGGGVMRTGEEESRVTASFFMGPGLAMWAGEGTGITAVLTVQVGSRLMWAGVCTSVKAHIRGQDVSMGSGVVSCQ